MGIVFFITGLKYWLLVGGLIAVISFQPAMNIEVLKSNKELMEKFQSQWLSAAAMTAGTITLVGGIVGFIIGLIFISRPRYEHMTPAPRVPGIDPPPFIPRHFQGPRSLAELHCMFPAIIVSGIAGFCSAAFIPSLFVQDLLARNSTEVIVAIGTVQSIILSVLILPSALKKISNIQR